ncbi:MAG: von Willebrand factor type A domain-containing protein [Polyangiaceae bacterium]|nr:von Willebrand factor type A domain-containing protein [Polyangiaceae bacterium]
MPPTTDRGSARALGELPGTALALTLAWRGDVLWVRHLAPARSCRAPELAGACLPPELAAEGDAPHLVRVDAAGRVRLVVPRGARGVWLRGPRGTASVWHAPGAALELVVGARAEIAFAAFSLSVALEPATRAPSPRFVVGARLAPFVAAAGVLVAAVLVASARATPMDEREREAERLELAYAYLVRAELDDERVAEPAPEPAPVPMTRPTARPRVRTRAEALSDAASFGMIGVASGGGGSDHERYRHAVRPGGGGRPGVDVNPPVNPREDPFSTFALDVDTGAYTLLRRALRAGRLPPTEHVRVEEVVNYFDYGYPSPPDGEPLAARVDAAPSPFEPGHWLVRVGVQSVRPEHAPRVPVHLVYLVDTSGSMQSDDKLGLAQESLRLLTRALGPHDTVALCTYAGEVREVLPPTAAREQSRILAAIDALAAGGSTAMDDGLALAYDLARRTRVSGQPSRVVVLSDGDANVGPSTPEELLATIRRHAGAGITLSTVGFGAGNYRDEVMERLADAGDGNYSYVDSPRQARRVFVDQLDATLRVVARDVKVQVELDPGAVASYRLLGYENRAVADHDFRVDAVDGGEVGMGHAATALYDVVFAETELATDAPWLTVRLRYKPPEGSERAVERALPVGRESLARAGDALPADYRFAVAAAGFAEVLRASPYAAHWTLARVAELAASVDDGSEDRRELVELTERARALGVL